MTGKTCEIQKNSLDKLRGFALSTSSPLEPSGVVSLSVPSELAVSLSLLELSRPIAEGLLSLVRVKVRLRSIVRRRAMFSCQPSCFAKPLGALPRETSNASSWWHEIITKLRNLIEI